MSFLHITDEIKFPDSVVTDVMAWMGRRSSGKTYGATKAAEEMHRIGAQFVALDSAGVWYGLRLGPDGKSPGLAIPIFGGLRGDVPITPTSGALIADVIVDQTLTAIVDTSQFEFDAEKNRFVADFANRLFYRKKQEASAVHVFLEESQEYCPQQLQKGEEKMLHHLTRMIRIGRNFGIGASMITQRPQDVNKKALYQAEVVFAFQLTGPLEIDAVAYWTKEKGFKDDLKDILPKLEVGHAHLWSPVLLKANREVHIRQRLTFPAGGTPKVGAKKIVARNLHPIEIKELTARMAETIEKAKAEDPIALQRQVAQLKAEVLRLSKMPVSVPVKAAPPIDIKGVVDHAVRKALLEAQDIVHKKRESLLEAVTKLVGDYPLSVGKIPVAGPVAKTFFLNEQHELSRAAESLKSTGFNPEAIVSALKAPRAGASAGDLKLGKAELAILTVLAQRGPCEKRKLAVSAGYSYKSGSFRNTLSVLRNFEKPLVETNGDITRITAAGLAAVGDYEPLPTGQALLGWWCAREGKAERAVLEALAAGGGAAMNKEELAQRSGYQSSSGSFRNTLSHLRTLGLIEGGSQITISKDLL